MSNCERLCRESLVSELYVRNSMSELCRRFCKRTCVEFLVSDYMSHCVSDYTGALGFLGGQLYGGLWVSN